MSIRPTRRTFRPSCEHLEQRELPASGMGVLAIGWALYQSAPVATLRTLSLGCKLGKLAWTGRAKFAFGLVLVAQPYPLGSWKRIRIRKIRRHGSHPALKSAKPIGREFEVRVGAIAVGPAQVLKVISRRVPGPTLRKTSHDVSPRGRGRDCRG